MLIDIPHAIVPRGKIARRRNCQSTEKFSKEDTGRMECLTGEIGLGSRRNDWPHKIEAVNCGRYAVERSDLTGKRIHAESLRAGSHEYSCAAFLFAGEGEGELDVRSGLELDVRVEENTATGDIAQLARVKIRRTASCQADLNREVNLITPCFSSLSHFSLFPSDAIVSPLAVSFFVA
jgi:hypothetical protein